MSTWTLYEFARIHKGVATEYTSDGLLLEKNSFRVLKNVLSDDDNNRIFKYCYNGNKESLTCQNYAGVICLPNGDQIEILPKLHRSSFADDLNRRSQINLNRKRLVKMLRTTRHLPYTQSSSASLNLDRLPLLDIFIKLFLSEVEKLVKRGVARNYQPEEENINFLKGKLLVQQQIRHNIINKQRHYMMYDELSNDRPENRLIRTALSWVLNRVYGNTQRLCEELLFTFQSIPASGSPRLDLNKWQRGRHLSHYEAVKPWLELIFNQMSPTSVDGTNQMLSLLFPMERVFEDYVATKLKQHLQNAVVKTQVRNQSLVSYKPIGENTDTKMFQLRPDLHITTNGRTTIGDTKWKLINQDSPSTKYGVSEKDIYQMLAYNQTYQKDEPRGAEIWLIYPKTEQFDQPLPLFKFDNGSVIRVLPFDIDTDQLLGVVNAWTTS
jgi:5-methylcytosine-specific restriction enzyme subunit McrC